MPGSTVQDFNARPLQRSAFPPFSCIRLPPRQCSVNSIWLSSPALALTNFDANPSGARSLRFSIRALIFLRWLLFRSFTLALGPSSARLLHELRRSICSAPTRSSPLCSAVPPCWDSTATALGCIGAQVVVPRALPLRWLQCRSATPALCFSSVPIVRRLASALLGPSGA